MELYCELAEHMAFERNMVMRRLRTSVALLSFVFWRYSPCLLRTHMGKHRVETGG